MSRRFLATVLIAAGVLGSTAWAPGIVEAQVTAVLTADNHYGLFHGSAAGDDWTFIGRNEMGAEGAPGDYNWMYPETFDFDAPPDHHLYVVAWDEDGAGLSMWVGAFTLPDGTRLVSDAAAWECLCGSGLSPRSGDVPFDDFLLADIVAGTFEAPRWSVPNGTEPWAFYVPGGLIPDVGDDASFIWSEDSVSEGACGDHYVIFRTVDPIGSASGSPRFIRGDVDADGLVTLSDAVLVLFRMFLGQPDLPCEDAGDTDDSGSFSLTDALITLQYLFLAGPAPRRPFGACGADPTEDALSCASFGPCP